MQLNGTRAAPVCVISLFSCAEKGQWWPRAETELLTGLRALSVAAVRDREKETTDATIRK